MNISLKIYWNNSATFRKGYLIPNQLSFLVKNASQRSIFANAGSEFKVRALLECKFDTGIIGIR